MFENPLLDWVKSSRTFTFIQDARSVLQAVKFDIVSYKTFLDTCGSDSECIMGCSRDSLDCNERCPCYDACPNGCPCPHSSGYCPTQVCLYILPSEKVNSVLKPFLGRIMHNRKWGHYSWVWWVCMGRVWAMSFELSGNKPRVVF